MEMDLFSMRNEAVTFCKASENSNLRLLLPIDEKHSKLFFSYQPTNLSFYVCPPTVNDTWSLWSEDEASYETLTSIIGSFDVEQCKSITEILQHVIKFLKIKSQSDSTKYDFSSDASQSDEEEDDIDDYYLDEDADALVDDSMSKDSREREEVLPTQGCAQTVSQANMPAVKRLMKDLQVIQTESPKFGIHGGPIDDDIFSWWVKLDVPSDTVLGRDVRDYAQKYHEEPVIHLEIAFQPSYPFSPPFIRVIKPRFKFLTGHVTVGGSICMEALTSSGWRPTNDIESILVQVRSEILSDPKARLDPKSPQEAYSLSDAKAAFQRMMAKYNWK